jgi:endoglucanase
MTRRFLAGLLLAISCGLALAQPAPLQMVHTEGTAWKGADGKIVTLKGVNLGNWLINEFWMMGQGSHGIDDECKLEAVFDKRFGYPERERLMRLFRDNWMRSADWDRLAGFGVNLVRLPFIHSVIEDEQHPGQLRPDAWHYLDSAVAEAGKRGIYVVLDLHGAVGSQGWEHHSGCAGRNLYWSTPSYQQRTTWLWQQIAGRYKDNPTVLGYSLLNEPWGTSGADMAAVVGKLYAAVRAVDPNHVILLPGHNKENITPYGDPAAAGMRNVALEMHFYPGHFGWGEPNLAVHRDWLECRAGPKHGVCEWDQRLRALNTAFFVGEMQPWAGQGVEQGGQVARASFDTYARLGWATAAWSYKIATNKGGHGKGNWGMVTNADGALIPALDFTTAPLADIEKLFRLYGDAPYESHPALLRWMTSPTPPNVFSGH